MGGYSRRRNGVRCSTRRMQAMNIPDVIKSIDPLIRKVDLIDVFHCSEEEYLKIRRRELCRKAAFCRNIGMHKLLDLFYPISKPLMEKLWGGIWIH